jgi:rod shape determining protein RodA
MSEAVRQNALGALLKEWQLFLIPLALSVLGILTMHPFGQAASLAPRQLVWLGIALTAYFVAASLDMRFIRRTTVIISGYVALLILLSVLLVAAHAVMGAKSWFTFGGFSFQPADLGKLVFVALIAKYFSRRHMAIGDFRHIIVAGAYAAAPILLILLEPDLGTAAIFGIVWMGMVLVSGISKKHLALVFAAGLVAASVLWFGGLHDYQRARIMTFINPAADIHGTGYNAYQATVAAGSGQVFGKGIGYGTQSKLQFLPEYETDFIFAAFAEEWGFVGVVLVLLLYGLLLARLITIASRSATNFDAFFTIGIALVLGAHVFVHAGINLGLLPVTGTTIPFMSYGGSHLLMEYLGLGIVASLAREGRAVSKQRAGQEFFS